MKKKQPMLDTKTLSYIEYLTEEKGDKAVTKYLKYAGVYEIQMGKLGQYPIEFIMNRAKYQAHHTKWKA